MYAQGSISICHWFVPSRVSASLLSNSGCHHHSVTFLQQLMYVQDVIILKLSAVNFALLINRTCFELEIALVRFPDFCRVFPVFPVFLKQVSRYKSVFSFNMLYT